MEEICTSIASKVAEYLVGPILQPICYAFKYQRNMEELKRQVKKLTNERESVQHSVDEAKRQGDEIEKHVQEWLESVDEFAEKVAKPIIDDQVKVKKLCSIGFCPSLMTRYSLSKKAVKTAKDGVDLLGEGKFQKVSYRLPPGRTNSIYIKDYEDFASRMSLSKSIMEALADADANLIGVYGMGGVGKTTLVKKVAQQAKENKLFDLVVTAVVTETPDIRKIQGQIADELGLKFQEEGLPGRAARIRERMKKENRILVILDNVWAKLDLELIGIPVGSDEKGSITQKVHQKEGDNANKKQCKILLTSRRLDVLRDDMDTQKNFKVEILSDAEGENLFWTTVGYSEEKSDLNPIAVEIVGKCGGLPVAIKTIANALKNKSLPSWKTARDQLKKANPKNIKGMNEDVYSTIELSFNFLEGEEAKSLFLLCSLCNGGYGVHITDILKYSMGLGLFQDVETIEEGRNKLHSLIDDLKTSCLLMDHDYDSDCVKMHDVIHAVAVSIASTTKLWFNLQDAAGLKEVLEKKLPKDSAAVSLPFRDIYELPEKTEFPKLELFLLYMKDVASLQIPDALFEGMKDLKVLDMSGIHLSSPPSSLRCLINLHTLCLDRCRLEDVAIIGELKELEVLSFVKSDIEQLPREIGQLTRLRLLDLSHCSKLKVIKPNVISSLTRLEELYMGDCFDQWDIEGQSNASLAELKQLSCLTALDIHVPNAQIIPQDLSFGKLERYRIFVGEVWDWSGKCETLRMLKLNSSICLSNEIKSLLNRTQDLHLDKLKGVKNVVNELNGEGFPQLKHLHVQNDHEIQYIANSFGCGLCNVFPLLESLFLDNLINLEKICHGQLATKSFSKLRIMKVRKCDRLKHLFSFSMVNNLSQLQKIEVTNCKRLEEIISKESMELVHQNEITRRIEFTQLHTLTLECLPQLTSFSFDASTHDIGSQEIVAEDEADGIMSLFSQNAVLPSLKNLKLSSVNIRCKWLDQLPVISSCCQALTDLTLGECNDLMFLFSYSAGKSLVQLQNLEIRNCKSIEGIINTEEFIGEEKMIMRVFPKLLNLQLKGLPKLSRFSSGNSVEFLSLTQISIKDCPNLKTFFSSSKYKRTDIKQSKEIEEMNCLDDIYPFFNEKVMLPTLASINLSSIPIRTIWQDQLQPMSSCFQNLKEIIMDGCDTVKHGFPSSMVESLVQLEVLEISNCKLMEVVTVTAGERISNTLFTKLQRLHLKHLPELTTFCNFTGKLIELTSLAQLWLENCPKMHAFVSNSPRAEMPVANEEQMNSEKNLHSHIQPFFDEKVRILDLKLLYIKKMDNIRKIWCHQLTMDSFSKIDSFEVNDCHNLLNIFPSNMLGRLQKLAKLEVSDCKSVEVIFEELNTTEEDIETVPRFVFPQLTYLLLSDLPSLRSLYPGLYISEWPKLNKLRMWRCNKVKILTSEFSNFEKSHGGSQSENSIQEQLFIVDKVAFPKIEHLALEWNWIVKEILHRNFSKYSCNLKVVELISASKQSGNCPCCFLCTLTNLEKLDVYYGFFEEIFTCEGLDCMKKHAETPSKLSQLKLFDLVDSLHRWKEDSLLCKVFQNLTSLEVLKCDTLKNLVPSFVSFQNLKKLEVSRCDGLVNLMEVSVAKSLGKLTRLKISECKMIEEIIMHGVDEAENRMIFNQLEYLELHSLAKLTSFCSWNCNIEFPSLQQVVVRQCPTMEIFSQGVLSSPKLQRLQTAEVDDEGSWEGSLNTTIQKLFKDMIGFRGLQHLTTSEFPHLKEVWHGQFPVQVFCNLKSLVMDDCANISSAISGNLLQHLNSLEKLHVRNGDSIKEVFDLEELNADGDLKVLSQLSEFFLVDLPRLEHIWKKNHSEVLGFRNLKLMKVYNCSSLRYIFTPSVILGLMQLQKLEIKNCAIMEEIITMEGENDAVAIEKITFLQLNCLIVGSLPNLTNFYSGSNTLECPSLRTINISHCPKTETFVFSEKVQLPSLASLNLHSSIASQTIWHNQLQGHSACFHNLTKLTIHDCHNLKYLFPFSVAESLNNLEVLDIKYCELMERVIITQGERKSSTLIPKLKQLYLRSLPELTRFCSFNRNSIELPSLSELNIWNCPKMQTFASDSLLGIEETKEVNTETEENLPSFFDEKVSFSCLKKLKLGILPELLHMWKKNSQPIKVFENLAYLEVSYCSNLKTLVPSSVSLQNLETLEVRYCEGLISLVAFSTAKSLEKLKRMEIIDCKLIEEIIIDTGDEINDGIVFNQLEFLNFKDLPSLTSFCKGSFTIEFPYLQRLLVIGCLKMMNFSQGVLSTPKLQSVQMTESSDSENEGCWEGDLNTTIQKLFRDGVGLRYIENFTVSNFPHLKEVWHEKFLASYFSNLKSLVVDDKCCSLRYIFTPSVALGLAQLRRLEIKNCVILEVITVIGEEIASNTMFPNLNSLELRNLPNLTCFCNFTGNSIELPSLTQLSIENCPNMETFISNFLGVDMSTRMDNCHTDIQPLFDEKVQLPTLAFLELSAIASQTISWHNQIQAHSACFHNLTELTIQDCHNLKYLFPFSVAESLDNLEVLDIWNCELLEGVIITQGERKSSTMFPKLKQLDLGFLPELTRFCTFNGNSIELPSLSELNIHNCPKMQTFASDSLPGIEETEEVSTETEENLPSFFDEKVSFSCLKELKLIELPELLHLWKKNSQPRKVFENLAYLEVSYCCNLKTLVPSSVSLQNLETLEVRNCDGLISLVTFSTAKSLEQLKRMEIIDCKLVEEIIIDRGDEIKDVIVFNQLEYLKLQDLPSLTSFCKGSFTIEFPYLQRVLVIGCLKMMNFSQRVLSTPKLQSLQMTKSSDEGCWEGDLNTTIQKLFRDEVGLHYIENFTVSNFPHLKEVWHEKFLVSCFSNLKSLVVDDKCCSLRYIFTPSVALGLAQLQDLEIKNCVILEVITVIGEETISNTMFPNLNSLELINLPNLACFCNFTGNSIELPSLTQLSIENCPNMETFISNFLGVDMSTSKDNCHTDIQPLFDEKVGLPNLEFLQLDKMDKLRKIWYHQLSSDSFCKLDSLRVYNCPNVLNVIPSNMLERLQKLDELRITNCSSLCEIFELQASSSCGKTQAITATQLKYLELNDLPKLKHIWDVDSQGLLTCQNLISIKVEGCDSLKSIFPASVGRNLVQLEELCIEKCCMVEEIFAKEEHVDEAVPRFPRLTFLRLGELPRLRSFYPRVHISEWPVLKKLHVWKCDRIEIFVSNFLSFQVNQGESQQEKPMEQPLLLLDKVPFNNLESLTLDWKWIEKESLHEKLPMYSCKLKVLTFAGFQNEANICISCFLHKLPDLERLQVRQGFFKEIFSFKGFGCEEKHVEAPRKLSILWLFDLFDSLHLWEENSLSGKVFQNLRILEVIKCGNLKCLVPSSVSFKNLTTLKVVKCDGLLNLVAAPTAKSMMQLTKLTISKCERIEEIIIHEGDKAEDIIIFKKLSYLELRCLPNLTSFYSGNYITEFPSLKQLVVRECPNMKTFSRGILRAPRLYGLQITETAEGKGYWKGNLNTTIEHLFTEKGQSSKED